ncbi:MAG: hypothetical protein ABFS02_08515, partial [Pseudomonadota bacterium]
DGMCWNDPGELYNDGEAFKLTVRDQSGVIITLLADNYYGYCKKEVKTQISYSANLFGLCEEEHAGGALAFQRHNHGDEYGVSSETREPGYNFEDVVTRYKELTIMPEGYGIDKHYPAVIYVPQDIRMDLNAQTISWEQNGERRSIRIRPDKIYIQPNGYKIEMQRHPGAPSWRLVGTDSEGTFCHKPCTVSGGGKSEISKSIEDAVIFGPLFVDDLQRDLDRAQEIFDKDYTGRFRPGHEHEDRKPARKPLSAERSLGSVIKLLTPSPSHTDEYKRWLESIPPMILALVFLIKRFYRTEWGDNWRRRLSVDVVDGAPGHELKLHNRKIIAIYLRVGFDRQGGWRTFKVRQDYIAAEKIQMEDDISTSVVVPSAAIRHCRRADSASNRSAKLVKNCEYRLFQRPDDAIIPGYDKQTEANLAMPGNFIANFEPLAGEKLASVVEDVMALSNFTSPMRELLSAAYDANSGYVVSSAHPRLVDGKPSKNPRYLETRPDLVAPVRKYVAEMGIRLHRKIPLDQPVCHPVDAVLTGRRNNPPEPGIRSLAVYNPIHYQELPELFMDFISSLTGKSPSTTGTGSEGALTKGPFNALLTTPDLNNALVSYILTGHPGFSSAAGFIGPHVRMDHDISLLIPEIWARLRSNERQPDYLIEQGYLERLEDFEHKGRRILASRLGYRITNRFVHGLMGKIFDNPVAVFTEEILKPETQDLDVFVDGIDNIVENHCRVARQYIEDGSIDDACPPLRALLHIMADGDYRGMDIHHPEIRGMFTLEYLLNSGWYRERLEIKQARDLALWKRHIQNLEDFLKLPSHAEEASRLEIEKRLRDARKKLESIQSPGYLDSLLYTIGADPLGPARETH